MQHPLYFLRIYLRPVVRCESMNPGGSKLPWAKKNAAVAGPLSPSGKKLNRSKSAAFTSLSDEGRDALNRISKDQKDQKKTLKRLATSQSQQEDKHNLSEAQGSPHSQDGELTTLFMEQRDYLRRTMDSLLQQHSDQLFDRLVDAMQSKSMQAVKTGLDSLFEKAFQSVDSEHGQVNQDHLYAAASGDERSEDFTGTGEEDEDHDEPQLFDKLRRKSLMDSVAPGVRRPKTLDHNGIMTDEDYEKIALAACTKRWQELEETTDKEDEPQGDTGLWKHWRHQLAEYVHSKHFEAFFACVIIASSLVMGAQVQVASDSKDTTTVPLFFVVCDKIFSFSLP
eukprot:TRINITY_DN20596_c0_g1_i2.p1 TRINITY_DN20596_c0_g1~~TRINITY_DN20596_c0_g1_i2.p1  ORF type:complete len:338 (+),score=58.06 TRINITY_DN20596_c0_g1_i2:95-1108(+)